RAGRRGAAARGARGLRAVRCRGIWARRNRRADGDRRGDLEGAAVPGGPLATGDAGVMTDRDTPPECRELLERAARLPKSIAPPRDLWPGIETGVAGKRPGKGERERGWLPWVLVPLAAAAILAVVLLGRRGTDERRGAWEVTRLAGLPVVGSSPLAASGAIRVGEWLETDDSSRAVILVGDIGHVEVNHDTSIRLGAGKPTGRRPAPARRALAAARSEDAVAVWHLLERVDPSLRRAVYDRLASLVPPPAGVTSEGALRLDRTTLDTYWNTIRRIAWRRIILRG